MKKNNAKNEISPYKMIEGENIRACPYDADESYNDIEISKKFSSNEYQSIEALILTCLYIFQFANKYNLERYINTHLPKKKLRPSYSNNIKRMYQDGAITKYIYMDTTLYSLTPASYKYFQGKKIKWHTHIPIADICNPTETISTSKILEKASLAQWHISMLCAYKDTIIREKFSSYVNIDDLTIYAPSYVEYNDKSKVKKRIWTISIPKSKKGYQDFAEKLERATELFKKPPNKRTVTLMVIVCASLDEIRIIGEIIQGHKEMRTVSCLFALDINTSNFKGLKNLYRYEHSDGYGKIEVFSIE